jgi:hypothetical protein
MTSTEGEIRRDEKQIRTRDSTRSSACVWHQCRARNGRQQESKHELFDHHNQHDDDEDKQEQASSSAPQATQEKQQEKKRHGESEQQHAVACARAASASRS